MAEIDRYIAVNSEIIAEIIMGRKFQIGASKRKKSRSKAK